jgi:hypothetical protein
MPMMLIFQANFDKISCYKASDSGQIQAAALGVVDPPMLTSTLETRQTQSSEMSTTLDLKARTND